MACNLRRCRVPGSDALKGCQLCSGHLVENHSSKGSNGKAEQDMEQQGYKHKNNTIAIQVPGRPHLLYGCKTWTLLTDTERKIQAFEMNCLQRLHDIAFREQKSNEFVYSLFTILISPQKALIITIKRQNQIWCRHVA